MARETMAARRARIRAEHVSSARPDVVVDTDVEQRRASEIVPLVHGQHYGQMRRRASLVTRDGYQSWTGGWNPWGAR